MKLINRCLLTFFITAGLLAAGGSHAASKPVVGIADFKKSIAITD